MTNTTDPRVEAAARILAQLAPGEPWPSNELLGAGFGGTREDEFRGMYLDQAGLVLAAVDAVDPLRKPRTVTPPEHWDGWSIPQRTAVGISTANVPLDPESEVIR